MTEPRHQIAVVDLGMGNLFSILRACEHAGLSARITQDPEFVSRADGIILPGVGAFEQAMETLHHNHLVEAIQSASLSRPLLGICLGMQLLMDESLEFGRHSGLGLLPGTVIPFPEEDLLGNRQKIPLIGWVPVTPAPSRDWSGSLLSDTAPGDCFYFVHSYHVVPTNPAHSLAESQFGGRPFCAALRSGEVQGVQFHPERSGPAGLRLYHRFASQVADAVSRQEDRGPEA